RNIGKAIAVEIAHGNGRGILAGGERAQLREGPPAVAPQDNYLSRLLAIDDGQVEIAVAIEVRGGDGGGVGYGDVQLDRLGEGSVAVARQERHAALGAVMGDGDIDVAGMPKIADGNTGRGKGHPGRGIERDGRLQRKDARST